MKDIKRKIAPILLLWLGIVLLLAACKPSGEPVNPTPGDQNADGEVAVPTQQVRTSEVTPTQSMPVYLEVDPEDLSGTVIQMVHPWVGPVADVIQSAATRFSLSNPYDIWVEVEAAGSDSALLDYLDQALIEGEPPGLVVTYPYHLVLFEDRYFSVPLTDYIMHPEWGLSPDALADIPTIFLDQYTIDGDLTAVPIAPQATVLFYNQTWAQELGFSSGPENDADFHQQSCAAVYANNQDKDEGNDGTGGWLISFDPVTLTSWYSAFGGELTDDGVLQFDTPEARQSFGYLKSVYDEGCIWIGRRPEPYYYFANRFALMYAGSLTQIPHQSSWMTASESADAWHVRGFPGPDGEQILIGGPGLVLTADTPEKQLAAWLFARFLLTNEVQADLAEAGFTLPVRRGALTLLTEFADRNPQWAEAVDMVDVARPLPISDSWGVGQWVLQDAIYSYMLSEKPDLDLTLEQLDAMINELTRE